MADDFAASAQPDAQGISLPSGMRLPVVPPLPSKSKPALSREDDIQHASELARKRSAQEAAIRQRIKDRRQEDLERSQQQQRQADIRKEEEKHEKKEYFALKRTRDKQAEADRLKKEQAEKLEKERQAAVAAEKKKKLAYMQDLRETARIKQGMEHHQNVLKAEWAQAKQKAELDHRLRTEQDAHRMRSLQEQAEREARSRRTVVDNEGNQKVYQLEAWHRMKIAEIESERRGQEGALWAVRDPSEAQKRKEEINGVMLVKRRRIENEFKEKKQAIDQETMRKRMGVEEQFRDVRQQIEMQTQTLRRDADRDLARKLEDIEYKYDALLHGKKLK
jgi:hypothetical protein